MRSLLFGTKKSLKTEVERRSWTRVSIGLLAFISLLAMSGIIISVFQEHDRNRVVMEYESFLLAAELLQAYDRGEINLVQTVDGLEAFGIYNLSGVALYRYGPSPVHLNMNNLNTGLQVKDDTVSLLQILGSPAAMRGRMRPGWNMDNGMDHRAPFSYSGRYVYVSQQLEALYRSRKSFYAGAALLGVVLVAVFVFLVRLAKKLDQYRANEARNRELLALGEAARTLSHEIKNPLAVLKIQCALLKKNVKSDTLQNIAVMEDELSRLALLTDRLRTFLTGTAIHPENIPLSPYMQKYVLRYGGSVRLVDLPSPNISVKVDRTAFQQILDNLVSNAFESMLGGESVPVEISFLQRKKGMFDISIADRGAGIKREDADRIFDLFYTTKTSGSGLGLAISRRLAESMGAELSYKPNPGGGSIFIVSIPEGNGV